jgi:hypothetical protein
MRGKIFKGQRMPSLDRDIDYTKSHTQWKLLTLYYIVGKIKT